VKSGSNAPKSTYSTVGYCNPPEHTRFKKGHSGNPKGRPKGALSMATVLERTLREKVVINENGRLKTVTKLEAAVKRLADMASAGELKAVQLLSTLLRSVEQSEVQTPVLNSPLDEADQKVILGIAKRFEDSKQGDSGDPGEEVR